MSKCQSCRKETTATIMSMFDTRMICLDCEQKEREDPRYEKARKAESDAVRRGDYNFRGIGR